MKHIMIIITMVILSSCAMLAKEEMVAEKSYEIGCIDHSDGSATQMYSCHQDALKYKKELASEWRKAGQ